MTLVDIKLYLHSSKESNYEEIKEQIPDISKEVLRELRYALYEVEFTLLVDPETGHYAIKEVKETGE